MYDVNKILAEAIMASTVYQPSSDVQRVEKAAINSLPVSHYLNHDYDSNIQLRLTSLLQTTLEIEPLFDLFFGQLQHLLKLNSCHYSFAENNIDIELGQTAPHSTDYTINKQSLYLGNIIFTRQQRFTEPELSQIESLIGILIHPLHNALRYKEALHQAMSDPLTGLGNRGALEQAFNHQLQMAQRYDQHFSLLMIDLDHFKSINDTYGHTMGDKVLREVAKSIQATTRQTDLAYRYGGEEFMVILNKSQSMGAHIISERIRENISRLEIETDDGKIIKLTTSIGGSSTQENVTPRDLMKQADKALYQAKNNGRNCVEFFQDTECSHIRRNLSIND